MPETAPVAPEELFRWERAICKSLKYFSDTLRVPKNGEESGIKQNPRWTFASSGSCTVLPDHLQSLDALNAAGLVGKDLDEAGIRTWLANKAGKECAVGRVRGLPSHWTVVQDGNCPLRDNEQPLLISSIREGEKVTYLQKSVVVPLHEEGQAEALAAQDVLVVALVMLPGSTKFSMENSIYT